MFGEINQLCWGYPENSPIKVRWSPENSGKHFVHSALNRSLSETSR